MLERRIAAEAPGSPLRRRLAAFPAVALVGPRQCGKTTLARSLAGRDDLYYDMEQPTDRLRLDLEWDSTVDSSDLIVIDEAQTEPDIFPRLRGAIDAQRRRNGRFLLLGSISPALMRNVSESLAGRLSVVELTPLSWLELHPDARDRLWRCGGYPDGGVLDDVYPDQRGDPAGGRFPAGGDPAGGRFPQWQRDYLHLLAQRDLPSWGLPAAPQTTLTMFRLLAARHGQRWNAADMGRHLSLSYHTVNAYLEYLEGAFLVRRLPAYRANLEKQLVKRPKIYWRDTGLLHCLLHLGPTADITTLPQAGASWEGHVIDQILTAAAQADRDFDAWHLRTATGREIDLVLRMDDELWAIEIKLTTSPKPAAMARLNTTADLINAQRRFLVTRQSRTFGDRTRTACNLSTMITTVSGRSTPS